MDVDLDLREKQARAGLRLLRVSVSLPPADLLALIERLRVAQADAERWRKFAGYCPRCGSSAVDVEHRIPPRRCRDCGDEWAGLYRAEDHLTFAATEARS